MHAKNHEIKKNRDKGIFFLQVLFPVRAIFKQYFHFRCVAHATFDRNLVHSADACFFLMSCVGHARARAANNPSGPQTDFSRVVKEVKCYLR